MPGPASPPLELLQQVFTAFSPQNDIITARHSEILTLAHNMGFKSCVYKDDHKARNFEVEYASQEIGEPLTLPKDRTFVYCRDISSALKAAGYAGVMVDGKNLLNWPAKKC